MPRRMAATIAELAETGAQKSNHGTWNGSEVYINLSMKN
jgi:hypothetical protein